MEIEKGSVRRCRWHSHRIPHICPGWWRQAGRAGVRGTGKEPLWEVSLGVSHGLRVSACGSMWESQGEE